MWYKALIAFMLNSGGFRSATEKGQVGERERGQVVKGDWNGNQKTWIHTPARPFSFYHIERKHP